jgi:hypothetical protein
VTPTLFDLPLRLGDTVALAEILVDVLRADAKPVSDEQRGRIASRAASIPFQCLRPWFGSVDRDPVHPAAYYICVDGVEDRPLMVRVALSTTPSSGLFPQAILIGRTHLGVTQMGPRELVINAVPFGPDNYDRIQVFSEKVNRAFLPKPAGMRPVTRVWSGKPARMFPAAFDTFRKLLKSTGRNQAAFAMAEGQDAEEFYFAAVWAAIRAGWREGYALQGATRRRGFELQLANVVGEISDPPTT